MTTKYNDATRKVSQTFIKAQAALRAGTIQYFPKWTRAGWTLVTRDGREMERTHYVKFPTRDALLTSTARVFAAEVYKDSVFINPRHAIKMGFLWAGGSGLSPLFQSQPIN